MHMKALFLGILMLFIFPVAHAANNFEVGYGWAQLNTGRGGHYYFGAYNLQDWHSNVYTQFSYNTLLYSPYPRLTWYGASEILEDENLFSGIGIVHINRLSDRLSSTYEFMLTFGIKYGRYRFAFRHLSNGGTREPNYGLNLMVFSVQF